MRADAKHNRAVHVGGFTVYVDVNDVTATGANPEDAVLGWAPPATGRAHGPVHTMPNCLQPPAQHPPAAVVRDHATMTDEELRLYGMPTRAMIPDPVEWANDVRTDETRGCTWSDPYQDGMPVSYAPPIATSATAAPVVPGAARLSSAASITPDTVIPPGGGTPYYTDVSPYPGSWAGWAAWGPHNSNTTFYRSGEGYFKVPSLGAPGHFNDEVSFWEGIGGINIPPCGSGSPSLVQAGWYPHSREPLNEACSSRMWVIRGTARGAI